MVVERVLSQLDNGCIFSGRQADGQLVRIRLSSQRIEPVIGEVYDLKGFKSSYVDQYRATWHQIDTKLITRVRTSGALLLPWLETLPNVGPKRAKRLLDAFGDDLVAALTDHARLPSVAAALDQTKPVLANAIAAQICGALSLRNQKESAALEEVKFLASLESAGVSDRRAARRLWRLVGGPGAKERLLRNPYLAASLIDWKAADHLGKKLLGLRGHEFELHPSRLLGAIDSCWKEILADGHTATTRSNLVGLLVNRDVDAEKAIELGREKRALLVDGSMLRAPGAAFLEDELSRALQRMEESFATAPRIDADLNAVVRDAETRSGLELSIEQRAAVVDLLDRPFGVLQGGAGVGKTTVMKVLAMSWEILGGNVLLGALAGKAALQLSRGASTAANPRLAYTVARLIGMFRRDRDGTPGPTVRLDERTLLVLDEASMLDTPSLRELVAFLPSGARLLLVGDRGQLPPVGIGCVFHDLVSEGSRVAALTQVRRQAAASPIPAASVAVREGNMPLVASWDSVSQGIFIAPETAITRLHDQLLALPVDLLVVAARKTTVETINARASLARRDSDTRLARLGPLATVAVGDPVVCTRNRYADGLFNGLLGRVTDIDSLGMVSVHWDGESEPRLLTPAAASDIELAYAITCHRAQGSSATNVLVLVENMPLVTREWLYTAITRARQTVILIASSSDVVDALKRRTRRLTGFHLPAWDAHGRDLR